MIYDYNNYRWYLMYGLAEAYYKKNHNLQMPHDFKTLDGTTYDEEGYSLCRWLEHQKEAYINKYRSEEERIPKRNPLTHRREFLLNCIGVDFDDIKINSSKSSKK